jgi:hypothetical protein
MKTKQLNKDAKVDLSRFPNFSKTKISYAHLSSKDRQHRAVAFWFTTLATIPRINIDKKEYALLISCIRSYNK